MKNKIEVSYKSDHTLWLIPSKKYAVVAYASAIYGTNTTNGSPYHLGIH